MAALHWSGRTLPLAAPEVVSPPDWLGRECDARPSLIGWRNALCLSLERSLDPKRRRLRPRPQPKTRGQWRPGRVRVGVAVVVVVVVVDVIKTYLKNNS